MTKPVTKARYEIGTGTIRSVPENYMLAEVSRADAAVDKDEVAITLASAFELHTLLQRVQNLLSEISTNPANLGNLVNQEPYRAIQSEVAAALSDTKASSPHRPASKFLTSAEEHLSNDVAALFDEAHLHDFFDNRVLQYRFYRLRGTICNFLGNSAGAISWARKIAEMAS